MVSPQSPNFEQRFIHEIGVLRAPQAKTQLAMQGGKVLKDALGRPIEEVKKTPEYLAAQRTHLQRFTALAVWDLLRADDQICFEAVPPAGTSAEEWALFADKLYSELIAPETGFTQKEIDRLFDVSEGLACDIRFSA